MWRTTTFAFRTPTRAVVSERARARDEEKGFIFFLVVINELLLNWLFFFVLKKKKTNCQFRLSDLDQFWQCHSYRRPTKVSGRPISMPYFFHFLSTFLVTCCFCHHWSTPIQFCFSNFLRQTFPLDLRSFEPFLHNFLFQISNRFFFSSNSFQIRFKCCEDFEAVTKNLQEYSSVFFPFDSE